MREAKTEGYVWSIVNRKKKCRNRVNERKMEEWKEYFKGLEMMEDGKKIKKGVRGRLRKEEIREVIKKLKNGKARWSGRDGEWNMERRR